MIQNAPSLGAISEKIIDLMEEHIESKQPLQPNAPLMAELGLDSLDMIETSFTLQEFFGFEFSDKNAIEELEEVLGDGSIIAENAITPLGKSMILQRMPELAHLDLPDGLKPMALQQYYTVETFARLIHEFYQHTPETCPQTGEPVVVDDFKLLSKDSRQPVQAPTGDELIDAWVAETVASLKKS